MDHCRSCMRRKNTSNISRVYENTYRKVTKADMKDLLELREEIDEIVGAYDFLNDAGIKCTNFSLLSGVVVRCVVFLVICVVF